MTVTTEQLHAYAVLDTRSERVLLDVMTNSTRELIDRVCLWAIDEYPREKLIPGWPEHEYAAVRHRHYHDTDEDVLTALLEMVDEDNITFDVHYRQLHPVNAAPPTTDKDLPDMLYTNHNSNLSHRHDVSGKRDEPADLVALSVLDLDEQLVGFDVVAATTAELIAAWHPWIICYLLDEDTDPSRADDYDEVVDAGRSGEIDDEAVLDRMIQMAEDDNEHLLIHYRRYHATQAG